MGAELYAIGGALVSALAAYAGHLLLKPKIQADARKAWAETDDLIVARLYRHIDRLDAEMENLRLDFTTYRTESDAEKATLIRENKRLKNILARLEKRLGAIEELFKLHPVTPEMQAALDKLDKIN